MNINRKTLILAIAAGMGLVPLTGVFATPLNLAPASTSGSAKPLYFPAEAKESSTDIYSVYSGAAPTGATNAAGQTVKVGGDLDVYVYTMPGYAVKVGEQKTLVVKVALTGGAKFNKAPVLVCPHSGFLGNGTTVSTRSVTLIGWDQTTAATNVTAKMSDAGGSNAGTTTGFFLVAINAAASQASYSFAFPDGFVIPKDNSGACILSLTAGEPYPVVATNSAVSSIKAVAGSSVDMTVEVTYDEFFTKVTKTATVPLISFATAYQATVSLKNEGGGAATKTAAAALIDVGTSSKKFISGTEPTLQAFVGHVIVTATDTTTPFRTFRDASGNSLSAGSLIDSATITLAGNPIGNLTKVSFNSAHSTTPSCASTTLIEAVPSVTTTSGSSVAAGTVTVTVTGGTTPSASYKQLISENNASVVDHKGMIVCLVADGNKVMDAGYISMTVNGVSKSGKVVELGVSSDYYEVKRNGTAVRVLNIPLEPTDAWKVNVRMFNTSNQPLAGVKGSLYAVDGTLIKDGLDLGTIPANSLKMLSSDAIIGMITGSTAKGRAWMLIQAPAAADAFKVQVLMKNPTGVLSNLSTDAID